MKTLFIILALLSTTLLASDGPRQEQKSVDQMLQDFKKAPTTKETILKNENVKLQLELQEIRRKYYKLKLELKEIKSNKDEAVVVETFTHEEVENIVANTRADTWYRLIKYTTGERLFLKDFTSLENVKWVLDIMIENDMKRIIDYANGETFYEKDLAEVVAEYKGYFTALKEREMKEKPTKKQAQ